VKAASSSGDGDEIPVKKIGCSARERKKNKKKKQRREKTD
jgi:hypothetical protein